MPVQAPNKSQLPLSPRERLLVHSAAVLRWLEDPAGVWFSSWLDDIRMREYHKLMEKVEPQELYRAQGSVGVIDLIKSLRADLHEYEKDVASGKVTALKEE